MLEISFVASQRGRASEEGICKNSKEKLVKKLINKGYMHKNSFLVHIFISENRSCS